MIINNKCIIEYIWIGGNGELRSKTRVLNLKHITNLKQIPEWNYDGSSTNQSSSFGNTEIIIKPCFICINPLLNLTDNNAYLVLCDTYDINNYPISTNNRYVANNIFNSDNKMDNDMQPWFGLEQEYFFITPDFMNKELEEQGRFYCGTFLDSTQRKIVEEHLEVCLDAGLDISGINAEVAPNQWEFQIGPSIGISAGDQLYIARFLLERIAEKYNISISYNPKPFTELNGSGCHTNFSTKETREINGLKTINEYIKKLEYKHLEHMLVYGIDNQKRLTGIHETAPYDKFSYGIGTRNTSIRIPTQTAKDNCGYLEDRRPASNMDPYLVTSIIYKTCCLE
jgi:glutamine synthetase